MCQPVSLVTDSSNISFVAVDDVNVYWSYPPDEESSGNVMACSINGCGSGTTIYALGGFSANFAMPNSSSVYKDYLYLSEGSVKSIIQVSKSTHAGSPLSIPGSVNVVPFQFAFDSRNSWVYYVGYDLDHNGVFWLGRIKPDGSKSNSAVLAGLQGLGPFIYNVGQILAVDTTNAYVGDYSSNANIYYCPLTADTCSLSNVVFSSLIRPQGVASNGTYVFAIERGASDNAGAVYKCPVNTNCGKPTPLAIGLQYSRGAVVADADNVYFTAGGLWRCVVAGCGGKPTLMATSAYGPIAQDASAIYFWGTDGVAKVAK
jgi:hypothetical protein